MTITIKDTEIKIKSTMRALIIYEQITKGQKINGMTDVLVYFYSLIISNCRDLQLDFDEFIDWIDENPSVIDEFTQWSIEEQKKKSLFSSDEKKSQSPQ